MNAGVGPSVSNNTILLFRIITSLDSISGQNGTKKQSPVALLPYKNRLLINYIDCSSTLLDPGIG